MDGQHAFTLLETVIVVALVVLLAVFLTPVLCVKGLQHESICLMNLKRLNAAATVYAADCRYYPTTGNTLDLLKGGSSVAVGMGLLYRNNYIPGGEDAVSSMLFCPSANPREVSRQPGHAHQALNAGFNTAASASCTYVGHFCTLTGKRLGINRPRGESPMLLADIVFDDNNPSGSPQQAHEGKTFSASMWDGSAKTHEFEQVQHVNLLIPRFSNRRHAGNIWHWAAKARR